MQRRSARIAWCLATLVLAALATAHSYRAESEAWRDMCWEPATVLGDIYFVGIFTHMPIMPLAVLGAGAIVLARLVRYRGTWYWVPQVAVMVFLILRLAGFWLEGGLPEPLASGTMLLTPGRWALISAVAISALATLVATALCMRACVTLPGTTEQETHP